MRFSKQREVIQNIVQKTNSHPTADWIFHKAKKEIPNISLGTVYRNLNQLNKNPEVFVLKELLVPKRTWALMIRLLQFQHRRAMRE